MSHANRPLNVLIIDDKEKERSDAKLALDNSLRNLKRNDVEAENFDTAKTIIGNQKFDLIVVDKSLDSSGFDSQGCEIIKYIRKSDLNKTSAVVGRSGGNGGYEAQEMIGAGADEFVHKLLPVTQNPLTNLGNAAQKALVKRHALHPQSYAGLDIFIRQAKMSTQPTPD